MFNVVRSIRNKSRMYLIAVLSLLIITGLSLTFFIRSSNDSPVDIAVDQSVVESLNNGKCSDADASSLQTIGENTKASDSSRAYAYEKLQECYLQMDSIDNSLSAAKEAYRLYNEAQLTDKAQIIGTLITSLEGRIQYRDNPNSIKVRSIEGDGANAQ